MSGGAAAVPGFPGGTAVSHLRVYDWPAADGQAGGSPHLHTASAEGYVVIGGTGALETLSGAGFRRTPLEPGTLLWFTPGTVHRLVNGGDLELLVVMQNAGLPEAGDAVLTYPPDVLADPDAYREATAIPTVEDLLGSAPAPARGPTSTRPGQAGQDAARDSWGIRGHGRGVLGRGIERDDRRPVIQEGLATSPGAAEAYRAMSEAARRRRDLAVEGYLALRERVVTEGPGALAELHAAAVRLVRDKAAGWHHHLDRGAAAQATATARHLDALAGGDATHLAASAVYTADPAPGPRRNGMCGLLRVWDLDGAHPLT